MGKDASLFIDGPFELNLLKKSTFRIGYGFNSQGRLNFDARFKHMFLNKNPIHYVCYEIKNV